VEFWRLARRREATGSNMLAMVRHR
jgi:hypothetical protein